MDRGLQPPGQLTSSPPIGLVRSHRKQVIERDEFSRRIFTLFPASYACNLRFTSVLIAGLVSLLELLVRSSVVDDSVLYPALITCSLASSASPNLWPDRAEPMGL